MSLVVLHPSKGLYLASCGGINFWSQKDSCGISSAMAFPDRESALEHFNNHNITSNDYRYVEVEADLQDENFASIESCIRAGIEAWEIDEHENQMS